MNTDTYVKMVVIDDDPASLELVEGALAQEGLAITKFMDPHQGLEHVLAHRPQIVLTDVMMPGLQGTEVLERTVAQDPTIEVVLMTAHYSTEAAVFAIQKGASDYLTKPIDISRLRERVGVLIAEARKRKRVHELDLELLRAFEFNGIVGRSPLILDMFSRIRRIAPHFQTALITGPTGSGKELVARALHQQGPVSKGPFAVCNCSAIVETLFESEVFGYVKGAFTGATQDKMGLFEFANGGTVFLDEIGEMPLPAQAKLLRVLQNHEVQRVGSPVTRKVDVRVIAATHRDLQQMVSQRTFREDLYYRLAMVQLNVPALADRREDIPLLERHFIEKFAAQFKKPIKGLSRKARTLVARYAWPGNVREMENVIANACMMAEGETVEADDLPPHLRDSSSPLASDGDLVPLKEMERRYVLQVLKRLDGNKMKAAQVLGIGRSTLYGILNSEGAEETGT
jgi:DNA-binding NtrC family response regulator